MGYRVVGGGGAGGGGPAPTVAIGPFDTTDNEPRVNAVITLPTVRLVGNLGVGAHITLPNVALVGGLLGVGAHIAGALALTLPTESVGAHIDGALALTLPTESVGAHIDGALALALLTETVGGHFSGSALGAPFYQSITSTNGSTAATSIVVAAPASIVADDLLVAIIGRSGVNPDTAPSGWVEILQQTQSGSLNVHISAWYKIATGSEPADYTWTWGANSAPFGAIIRLNATDPTTPVNTSDDTPSSIADPVAPALTTTSVNCFLIAACVQTSAVGLTYTAPSGYTERAELDGNTTGAVHLVDGTIATKVQAASGSVAAATMNSSTLTAVDSIAIHIAIAPGSISIGS